MKAFRSMCCATLIWALLTALSGCNAVKGLGKDIEKAGETIQRGADKQQKN